jgi:hypothetical protein
MSVLRPELPTQGQIRTGQVTEESASASVISRNLHNKPNLRLGTLQKRATIQVVTAPACVPAAMGAAGSLQIERNDKQC